MDAIAIKHFTVSDIWKFSQNLQLEVRLERIFKYQSKCKSLMCSSGKYLYYPHRREWNFLGGGGSLRPKHWKKCIKLPVIGIWRNFKSSTFRAK